MAKYAVVECNNGNFGVVSEWTDNKDGAISDWHRECRTLMNAPDVKRAVVKVVDEDFNLVDGKQETIFHPDEMPAEDDTEVEPA